MSRLWQRAVALSGNPAIALNIARVRRPAFHVVGYALMSSRNLAEGFARLERYQRIIAEASDLTFRRTPQGYRIGVTVHGDRLPAPPQSAECSLAYLVDMVRWITGRSLDPLAVELPGAPREPLAPYVDLFRAPLRFTPRSSRWCFPRRPRDAATLGQRGAGPVARSLRRRIPGAFQYQPHYPSDPADLVPAAAAGRTQARTGGPGAAPVAAHLATAPPGRRHQLPATARRHAPGYGRTVSPAARPDLAGSRLPAGFRRSEQFLPGIPPLVRLHAQRIPGAPPGRPG